MIKHKLRILGILPILSILLLCGFITQSSAAQFEAGDYTLEQSEIIEENLYISEAQTITIDGVVDGDLFAAAENLTISGTITGDIYAAGRIIDISGNVYGNVFLAAQAVDISGSIAQNTTIATAFSDVSGTIGRDLLVFASESDISGKVMEDVRVFTSISTISGAIKGESMIFASTSTIDKNLAVGEIYENIGSEIEEEVLLNVEKDSKNGFFDFNPVGAIMGFIAMYIVGIVLIYVAPVKALKIEKKVNGSLSEFFYSFLIGLAVVLFLPFPLIILSFTVIGAPLALIISAGLVFVLIFGKLWVESAIGYKILGSASKKDDKRFLSLLVGRSLTTIINFIPLIRTFYKWTLGLVAVGAVVRMKYDCFKDRKTKKVATKKKVTKKKAPKKSSKK
ncbi:polymer-forming cytoskeletal protein [bacterium]|nr:polymer-forming cytoskeletal protein [bacterium]